MKKIVLITVIMTAILTACTDKKKDNPFFSEWNTPYGVPPFDQIKHEHYMPAFEEGIKQLQNEINSIVENTEVPTFENIIVAMDNAGAFLNRVSNVFFNISGSDSDDIIRNIESEISPKLTKCYDDIYLNEKLFEKVKAIYEQKDNLNLDAEAMTLLEKTYKGFVRSGAKLNSDEKAKLRTINEELSTLGVKYRQNALADNNDFKIIIDNENDLSGLPENVIIAAAEKAKEKGLDGKWVFTLDLSSREPFLQYADNRDLRKQMLLGYSHKANNNNDNNNKEVAQKIASLEYQKTKLLGYKNYASFALENRMAKTPEKVYDFLHSLWTPTQKVTEQELQELQEIAKANGQEEAIEPWDWWYYTEKLRKEKYNFDEEEARPYFKLENVRDGAFLVANKLYGITFEPINDIPSYNPEASAYLVKDADDSLLGVFYVDYHPRSSKSSGAWMSNFREQKGDIRPIIINVCNFTKPTANTPSLLSIDEVRTLYHELGHALHGLLSKCQYYGTSGTNVLRDFVELPSQINENWSMHPEVLKMYAKHYQTGEIIPDEIINKIQETSKFNQGFKTTEYLAASFLDMAWYTLETDELQDVEQFEKAAMDKINLISAIIPRYRSTYFTHIFSGGYATGYYSYIWAEVLDADAFAAFVETGDVFDQATATAFRKNILERGGSEDPMELYIKFRGKEPDGKALLIKRGLL